MTPMPPLPSSRTMRNFGWAASSGGTLTGGAAGVAFRIPLGAAPACAIDGEGDGGREEEPGLAAWTLPGKESAGKAATALRQAAQVSRWAATVAAWPSDSWPWLKWAKACAVGWLLISGMVNSCLGGGWAGRGVGPRLRRPAVRVGKCADRAIPSENWPVTGDAARSDRLS